VYPDVPDREPNRLCQHLNFVKTEVFEVGSPTPFAIYACNLELPDFF